MNTSIAPLRKLMCALGLAFAALTAFPPAAPAGGSAASAVRAPESRALMIRSQELNRLYGSAESLMTPEALRALRERGEAMNRFYRQAPSPVESGSTSHGVDWTSVGISAGGMLGLMAVAAAALLGVRRRHARFA